MIFFRLTILFLLLITSVSTLSAKELKKQTPENDPILNQNDWVEESAMTGSKLFSGDFNLIEAATEDFNNGNFKDAIDLYEDFLYSSEIPANRAKAIYHIAICQKRAGQYYNSYISFKDLLVRYQSYNYVKPSLSHLLDIALYYESDLDAIFTNSRKYAIDIYELILATAPYAENSAMINYKIAKLKSESINPSTAIDSYENIIYNYRGYDISGEAELELAILLFKTYEFKDESCEQSKRAMYLFDRYIDHKIKTSPESSRIVEAKLYKKKCRERIANRIFKRGVFYTYPLNQQLTASRRYFSEVIQNYGDCLIADEAEVWLRKLDPANKVERGVVELNEEIRQIEEAARTNTFERMQHTEKWEKQQKIHTPTEEEGKWLLPLYDIPKRDDVKKESKKSGDK